MEQALEKHVLCIPGNVTASRIAYRYVALYGTSQLSSGVHFSIVRCSVHYVQKSQDSCQKIEFTDMFFIGCYLYTIYILA